MGTKKAPDWEVAVEDFLEAATADPKKLDKARAEELRKTAIAALRKHYGTFDIKLVKKLADDPVVQLMVSGQLAAEGWQRNDDMDKLRNDRRCAIHRLSNTFGWGEERLMERLRLAANQSRIVETAVATVPTGYELPDWTEEEAKEIMVERHKEILRRTALAKEARAYRDPLILSMVGGRPTPEDRPWTGAEIARIAHTTNASVTVLLNPNTASRMKKRAPKETKAA